jgi:DNA primase
MEEWPLSLKELAAAKPMLHQKISFVDVAKRATRKMMPCWQTKFTHKCACPFHADGMERTPSLYFSEESKLFYCFACNINGDLFDFISYLEGRPWSLVVQDLLNSEEIDTEQIDVAEFEAGIINYDIIYHINFELSERLRDYLFKIRDKSYYKQEQDWVDKTYKRIDERLSSLDDSDEYQAKSFRIQICAELERRKAHIARKYEDRNNRGRTLRR